MVREKGSIFVSDRSATRKKVQEAYEKAEEEQWNTREEKEQGTCNWTGGKAGEIQRAEEKGKEDNDLWKKYRQDQNPKWTRERKTIVPTCPPHPIGIKSERERKRMIDQWVERVLREDNMRRRGAWGEERGGCIGSHK